jgi:hypothetical protein
MDRTTGKEALACLVGVATLELYSSTEMADISKVASVCHLNGVRIRDHLHGISLTHVNGCYRRFGHEPSANDVLNLATGFNRKASTLLKNSCFDNLYQLRLTFHAPIYIPSRDEDDDEGARNIRRAVPIDGCLENFDLYSITRLRRLQKVVFIAKTHQAVMVEEKESRPEVEYQGERMEHLHAVADMARQVKATFQARGQKVIVQVCLKLSDRSHEETLQ